MTAINEIGQGFAHKFEPCTRSTYEIDCDDIVDLTTRNGTTAAGALAQDMACAWPSFRDKRRNAPSQLLARALMDKSTAAILMPSDVDSATDADKNCVLWKWGPQRSHKVIVFDPSRGSPLDQLYWENQPTEPSHLSCLCRAEMKGCAGQ